MRFNLTVNVFKYNLRISEKGFKFVLILVIEILMGTVGSYNIYLHINTILIFRYFILFLFAHVLHTAYKGAVNMNSRDFSDSLVYCWNIFFSLNISISENEPLTIACIIQALHRDATLANLSKISKHDLQSR